jgi:DNA-binding transcriptional ArsR family regulator
MATPDKDQVFDRAAELCALLSVPERLRIVRSLHDGERTFEELLRRTGIAQPDLLPHLNTLCRSGLVTWRHSGADVFYGIADSKVSSLVQYLASQTGKQGLNLWGGLATPHSDG